MENKPRVFDSEIQINSKDEWYFRGDQITLVDVLKYFKEQLKEDENGIYILNQYKNLSEIGYINCNGFPLQINHINELDFKVEFVGENSEKLNPESVDFYFDETEKIFLIKKNQKFLKYKIHKNLIPYLSNFLYEEENQFFFRFNDKKYPINPFKGTFKVDVPSFLKSIGYS
jgi:hypothetical protein